MMYMLKYPSGYGTNVIAVNADSKEDAIAKCDSLLRSEEALRLTEAGYADYIPHMNVPDPEEVEQVECGIVHIEYEE